MKEIPLTQGKVALVDDADYERLVAMGKWHFHKERNGTGYAVHGVRIKKSGKSIVKLLLMHRVILRLDSVGVFVDHIDCDKLNNTKVNLRTASIAENARNKGLSIQNKSGYKGVYIKKQLKKYGAQIRVDGKQRHLGYFDCPIEAAKTYNTAAIKYHGEFAKLNPL